MKGLLIQLGIDNKVAYSFLKMNMQDIKLDRYFWPHYINISGGSFRYEDDFLSLKSKRHLDNYHRVLPLFLIMLKNFRNNNDIMFEIEEEVKKLDLTDRIYFFKRIFEIKQNVEETVFKLNLKQYDFIGLSTISPMDLLFTILLFTIKKTNPNVKIICGSHWMELNLRVCQLFSDLNLIDSLILGEAEYSFPEVIKSLEQGKLIRFKNEIVNNLENEKFPEIVCDSCDLDDWGNNVLRVNYTRGCTNRCSYCMYTCKYRSFNLDNILLYIERANKETNTQKIYFVDEWWTAKTTTMYAEKYLQTNLSSHITGQYFRPNVNVIDDEFCKMLLKLKARIYFGIETFSDRLLDLSNRYTTVEKMNKTINMLNTHKIEFCTASLFLLPTETEEEFNCSLTNFWEIAFKRVGTLTWFNSFRMHPLCDFYRNNKKYGIFFRYFPESVKNIIPELGQFVSDTPCSYSDETDPDDKIYDKKWNKVKTVNRLLRKTLKIE